MRMRVEHAVSVLVSALVAGCVGIIGGDDGKEGGKGDAANGPTMEPRSPNLSAAPAHARRLSATELRHSMRDVFGVDEAKIPAFPGETSPGQFEDRFDALPVTPVFMSALQTAAEWVAADVAANLASRIPCAANVASSPGSERSCAEQFVDAYGLRLYRRPVTAHERAGLLAVYDTTKKAEDFSTSIATVIEAMLEGPGFLFRTELGRGRGKATPLTPYEVASALSYYLWQSTPDHALLDAAAGGKLSVQTDIEAQAKRMLADPRAGEAARTMFLQWLAVTEAATITKVDPAFSPTMGASMRTEVSMFVEKTVWAGGRGFQDLLTGSASFIDRDLAVIYGAPAPEGSGHLPVNLDPAAHAGVLTMPAFIATHSPGRDRGPIQLGHFVRSAMLCQSLPAAPPGIPPAPTDPDLDVRARYGQHEKDPTCASCHRLMDPIGFGWSQFDVVGRFSPVDHGVTQDGRGELTNSDIDGPFVGPVELGRKLAKSPTVQSCFVGTVLRWALGREATISDPASADTQAVTAGKASGFAEGDLKNLFAALSASDAFLFRDTTAVPAEGGTNP
jgi:hypothetical protein